MCDCETPEFFEQWEPNARKPHRCCECKTEIQPGEKYLRSNGKWDGEFMSFATCSRCAAVAADVMRATECCVPFGHLVEELWHLMRDARPSVEEIRVMESYRAYWRNKKRAEARQQPTLFGTREEAGRGED